MRVKIGNYLTWYGPFQIAEILCFWAKDVKDEYGIESKPDWVHDFGKTLADTWLGDFCQWVHDKRKRTEKIHIDRWDTWNMENTLSMIIIPMLKQLKETNHGAPHTDDEDVPEELRSTNADPRTQEEIDCHHADSLYFKRWNWIMDEMIWAHEQNIIDWDSQYHSGERDVVWTPVDKDGNEVAKEDSKLSRMDKGPNDTSKFDKDGYTKHAERMANGFKLFGKYYQGLWD